MNKYLLLLLLNTPFVFFGLVKSMALYRTHKISRISLIFRLLVWLSVFIVLLFSQKIYTFLLSHNLTDSSPLSLPDVVLATGMVLSLSLCLRLYARIDTLEKKVSDLHEVLSIITSIKN